MKTCKGCGAVLQNSEVDKQGYVKNLEHQYCLNCFSLKHYNKPYQEIAKTHFPKVDKDSLIVYLISTLHLNLLFKYDLRKFYPTQKIILLINKIDLMPKTIDFDKWILKITKEAQQFGFEFLEIMPISALKGNFLDIFLETLTHYNFSKVYFVGLQNSGKSTLINKISQRQNKEAIALTSQLPGLTKEQLELKYNDITIIDTPGIFEKGFISDFLNYNQYNKLFVYKNFKPKTYFLNEKQAIVVGGLFIVSFLKGEKTSFTFYLENLNLHRTKYDNVYNLFTKHQGGLFIPTITADYEKRYFKLDAEKYTFSFFDLGYLVVQGPATIEIYCPKHANITYKKGTYHGL